MRSEQPTVLIVEDEPDLADAFEAWLANEYQVRTVYDGESALEQYDETVDVVLLDRRMPGLSGDEVLRQIRQREGEPRIAMVTAVEPDVDVFDLGFDDYLVKPVLAEDLRQLVERLVRRGSYDDYIQEHYALVSKLVVLEQHNPQEALDASTEYQQLLDRLETIEERLEAEAAELTDRDFAALLRRQDSTAVAD